MKVFSSLIPEPLRNRALKAPHRASVGQGGSSGVSLAAQQELFSCLCGVNIVDPVVRGFSPGSPVSSHKRRPVHV